MQQKYTHKYTNTSKTGAVYANKKTGQYIFMILYKHFFI